MISGEVVRFPGRLAGVEIVKHRKPWQVAGGDLSAIWRYFFYASQHWNSIFPLGLSWRSLARTTNHSGKYIDLVQLPLTTFTTLALLKSKRKELGEICFWWLNIEQTFGLVASFGGVPRGAMTGAGLPTFSGVCATRQFLLRKNLDSNSARRKLPKRRASPSCALIVIAPLATPPKLFSHTSILSGRYR